MVDGDFFWIRVTRHIIKNVLKKLRKQQYDQNCGPSTDLFATLRGAGTVKRLNIGNNKTLIPSETELKVSWDSSTHLNIRKIVNDQKNPTNRQSKIWLILTYSNVFLLLFIHIEDLMIKGVTCFTFLVKKIRNLKIREKYIFLDQNYKIWSQDRSFLFEIITVRWFVVCFKVTVRNFWVCLLIVAPPLDKSDTTPAPSVPRCICSGSDLQSDHRMDHDEVMCQVHVIRPEHRYY